MKIKWVGNEPTAVRKTLAGEKIEMKKGDIIEVDDDRGVELQHYSPCFEEVAEVEVKKEVKTAVPKVEKEEVTAKKAVPTYSKKSFKNN